MVLFFNCVLQPPPPPLTSPYNETTPDSIFLNEVPVINVNQIVSFLVILF